MSLDEFNACFVNFTDKPKQGTSWNTTLDIGSTIKIPVSGYIKVLIVVKNALYVTFFKIPINMHVLFW